MIKMISLHKLLNKNFKFVTKLKINKNKTIFDCFIGLTLKISKMFIYREDE